MKPKFVLIAGPNGSGKSTLVNTLHFNSYGIEALNPDELAKLAPPDAHPLIWSGRRIHELIQKNIELRQSFSLETTLSGNSVLQTIADCKIAGMFIIFHFVFVNSVETSKARVRERVADGGHDVAEADQERRFKRSIANAKRVLPLTDEAYFYDNSTRQGHQRVAIFENAKPQFFSDEAPDWIKAMVDGNE